MKITLTQGPFLPVPPVLGGAMEKFFFALGCALAQAGHTVTHISRAHPGLPARQLIHGVQHLRIPSAAPTGLQLVDKATDLLFSARVRASLPPADVLITNSFFLPIFCRHPQHHGRVYPYLGRFPRGQLGLYAHVAGLLAPSSAVVAAARAQAPHQQLHLVPLCLPQLPAAPRPRTALCPPFRLLYAGRLHPEKGLHLLLQSLALLPSALQSRLRLSIVGPHALSAGGAGPRYLSYLKDLAGRCSTPITFVGALYEPAALAAQYAQADLFVYPSLAAQGETFGVAPLEALSHGTPVLASQLACFSDFLLPSHSFSFDHLSAQPAQALAGALSHALAQADRWPQLSAAAIATAQSFSLPCLLPRLFSIFTTP